MIARPACEYLLSKTYEDVWYRGEVYAERGLVNVAHKTNKEIRAVVRGGAEYITSLSFSHTTLIRKCTCPYALQNGARSPACKHMVALAIIWDEARHIERPTREQIETETIPPPLVSRFDIERAEQNPLKANLEILRLASSSGQWQHAHARLPLAPSSVDITKATREFLRWSKLASYDSYHCAGEMIAAFCELMRSLIASTNDAKPLLLADTLLNAQELHSRIVQKLIDNSDGFHSFSEAHLDAFRDAIKKERNRLHASDIQLFEQKLWNYDVHRND